MEYSDKKLQSRYIKSFVFISEHNFTIPSKILRVFNPKTNELTYLKTKAYFIEVDRLLEIVNSRKEPISYLIFTVYF
jgi:hypothetical protein